MKKFLISLNLIVLSFFFTINFAYCEEDFFLDTPFEDAKSKPNIIQKDKIENIKNITKQKTNWFSKFFKDKISKKEETEEAKKGYWGVLPDIENEFKYKRQDAISKNKDELKIPSEEDLYDENLKKAPYDDALFLDVIVKKEKSSNYLNDIQRIKFALSNLKKCIEEDGDIQRFNACVNVIDLYSKNLKLKYQEKSESLKESYIDILTTNYHAKILGNLLYDSNYYARYIPTSQGKYSEQNIKNEKSKLLARLNKTLFLINNET